MIHISLKVNTFRSMSSGIIYWHLLHRCSSLFCSLFILSELDWKVVFSQVLTCCCLIFLHSPHLIRDAHTTGLVKYREPYPFGVDPSWRGSRSELSFLNSLKMKMSILFGVVHMNLGIILSYFNARFFGNSLDIRCATLLTRCNY